MIDACTSWRDEPVQRQQAPLDDRGPTRGAILAIIGLSLLAWIPVAVPLFLLLDH